MAITTHPSIITLNVNEVNAPSKMHSAAEWIRKQDPYICCLQETHCRLKVTRTEGEGIGIDVLCQRKKRPRCSTYIRQNRL